MGCTVRGAYREKKKGGEFCLLVRRGDSLFYYVILTGAW